INKLPAAAHFPTWLPWLRNFEDDIPGLPVVADTDARLIDAGNGQVFAEAAEWHVGKVQMRPPALIMIGGIRQHRLVDAAVVFAVGLLIADYAQLADVNRPCDGRLEKRSRPAFLFPIRRALVHVRRWLAYLDGDDRRHGIRQAARSVSSASS